MAVLSSASDPNKKRDPNLEIEGSGGSGIVGGGGNLPKDPGTSSGQWTNLSQYRDANPDSTKRMIDKVSSNIQSERGGLSDDIESTFGSYNRDTLEAQNRMKARKAALGSIQSGDSQKALSDWGSGGYDAKNFTQETETPTWGNQELEKNIQNWEDRAKAAGTESGLFSEVGKLHKPQTTKGQGFLDQYLAQTSTTPLSPESSTLSDEYENKRRLATMGVGDFNKELSDFNANAIANAREKYNTDMSSVNQSSSDYNTDVQSYNDLLEQKKNDEIALEHFNDAVSVSNHRIQQAMNKPGDWDDYIRNEQAKLDGYLAEIQGATSRLNVANNNIPILKASLDDSTGMVSNQQADLLALQQLLGESGYTPTELSTY